MQWIQFKDYLSQVTTLNEDALHIYAAVLIQLAAAVLLRRSLASVWPWLAVWVLIFVNEALDLWLPGDPLGQWQIVGTIQDSWNTMAIPTLLWLLAYHAPALLVGQRARPALASEARPPQP